MGGMEIDLWYIKPVKRWRYKMNEEIIGKRIREARLLAQMTQEELADRIGVSFQQIQKYENATNKTSCSRLWLIAKALSMPMSYFFYDTEIDVPKYKKKVYPRKYVKHAAVLDSINDEMTKHNLCRLIVSVSSVRSNAE